LCIPVYEIRPAFLCEGAYLKANLQLNAAN